MPKRTTSKLVKITGPTGKHQLAAYGQAAHARFIVTHKPANDCLLLDIKALYAYVKRKEGL